MTKSRGASGGRIVREPAQQFAQTSRAASRATKRTPFYGQVSSGARYGLVQQAGRGSDRGSSTRRSSVRSARRSHVANRDAWIAAVSVAMMPGSAVLKAITCAGDPWAALTK